MAITDVIDKITNRTPWISIVHFIPRSFSKDEVSLEEFFCEIGVEDEFSKVLFQLMSCEYF